MSFFPTPRRTGTRADVSEAVLLLRCGAGDEAALEALYDRFGERTLRYLRGVVGDDAEDVQQDVWVTVIRRVAQVANPAAFRTWLFRTTRNAAIDFLRRRSRFSALHASANEAPEPMAKGDPPDPLLGRLVRSSLEKVSPEHREILILRYWEDMSYAEIAVVLGEPVGTVRSRLHWAKHRLKQELDPSLEMEGVS